ncbi:hypothetical protein KY338_06355 [Candidatus Woesearchaeota archaeon]|nr:hypothetical protein [Candidatus Woesearchaeota archaeon]MBW3005515.1 hypothetical protein [Candidatus Woesearchaeota archaeon]
MKKELAIIAVLVIFVLVWNPQFEYDENLSIDPNYVLDAAGIDKTDYFNSLIDDFSGTRNLWAKGDALLVLARLDNNKDYYKYACDSFHSYSPDTDEEAAILYETFASLNCKGTWRGDLRDAAYYWNNVGVRWRADILEALADEKPLALEFDTSEIRPALEIINAEEITIGNTEVVVEEDDVIVSQVDRVLRDWLGLQLMQSPFDGEILRVFSEKLTYSEDELREDIGWHEGGRLWDIENILDVEHIPAVGTLVAKKDNKWYAPDENGVFRFEVPLDKVSYPTTRFLTADLAVVVDSHGMNMLVEQAVRNKADVVIACCDHPGKIKAVEYLSEKGISAICFTDLDLYLALGHDVNAVGSAPFEFKDDKLVFGGKPITIRTGQEVIVTKADVGKTYAIWYYDTPYRYFSEVSKTFPLELITITVDDFKQTHKVYDAAREAHADTVASRVFNKYDYNQAKAWLEESKSHKLILFHSISYPYGILISQEFPEQVGFGDVNINRNI